MKLIPTVSSKLIPIILIGAALIIGGIGLIQMQTDDEPETVPLTAAGTAALDRAGNRLKDPGLYVAKEVPYSRLGGDEFKELKTTISEARLPVRVAVVPSSITRDGRIDATQLVAILHRRVDKPGVYAVLIDDGGIGRLDAAYWPTKSAAGDEDATAEVKDAVTAGVADAADCCTREYAEAIDTFVKRSMETPSRALSIAFWILLFVGAVVAVWWRWLRRADSDEDDPGSLDDEVIEAVSTILTDEVSEVSYRVAALPRGEVAKAKNLLARAEARSLQLAGSRHRSRGDLVALVGTLADLRFELAAIDALRLGKGALTRTTPCFIDPRHGPSEAEVTYTPTGLAERSVRVCGHCAMEIRGGQRPAIRRLPRSFNGGVAGWANYWEGDAGAAYVEGYWGDAAFPDEEFERARVSVTTPGKQDPIDILKQRLRTDRE